MILWASEVALVIGSLLVVVRFESLNVLAGGSGYEDSLTL